MSLASLAPPTPPSQPPLPGYYGIGKTIEPNHNVAEQVIQPDDALSHGNLLRSPFDPRSEEDLLSSTYEGNESGLTSGSGRHRRHHRRGYPEDENGAESSFDNVKLSAGFGRHTREHREGKDTNNLNAYDVEPLPAPRHSRQQGSWVDKGSPRLVPVMNALQGVEEGDDDGDGDDDGSWVDEESRLRPPALPINLEAALAELPSKMFAFSLLMLTNETGFKYIPMTIHFWQLFMATVFMTSAEDSAMRTKRLRPLQYPLYVNVAGDHDGIGADTYERTKSYGDAGPLRTMDQNIPEEELPDTLLIRTRRRTMSGVTGFLPRSSTLSSSSIWFGDHPVPTKTQIYAAEQSPLRLSSIQLQAQAEIARRRSRNNLAAHSLISIGDGGSSGTRRSRSLERSRTLGPSASALYGPTGRRVHGGAPIVERAIKRHASKRDGYETLSLVHVPRLEEDHSSIISATATEQRKLRRPASSASMARYWTSTGTSQLNGIRNRDKARSLIAQAAVDLAVHTHDVSEV
ncbi:unnamed protein product [Taenia asiatica]|uniref:SUN domain-containing protein n=1 Tax=Taenia asiatica TaxID=60517 RepID=A0A0R3W7L7_TAEAS|nr:unnamed protein product [Taenia asiatica]